jgi:uncharacterized protein (DUF58 family)
VNTANNLIYLVVSALLGFMGISGFFGRSNLLKIKVKIDLAPEIYATTNTPVGVTVKNTRRFLPIFLLRVTVQENEFFFPFIDAGDEATKYVNMSFGKRGEYTTGLVSLHSVFPFNFFTRYKWYSDTSSFVVYPKLQQCELSSLYQKERRLKGDHSTDKAGYESDIISIREYVHGDPIKYINWKATAKTGELKTKELSSLAYQPIVIDFTTVDIEDIEQKISCIAYTIVQLIRKNIPIGLRLNGAFFAPAVSSTHKATLLTELALYGYHEK